MIDKELIIEGPSSTTNTSAYSGGGRTSIISNNINDVGIISEATTAGAVKNPSDAANICNNSNPEQNLRCPRCDSSNTKFCYYNNYNLTKPRHFCKTCRRYWTKGGALRNVPIGGGYRKNKTSFTGKPRGYSSVADHMLNSGLSDSKESSLQHPIFWSSPQQSQTSHILDFLRPTQNSYPSNNTYLISSSPLYNSNQAPARLNASHLLNRQTSLYGLDYPGNSFMRNKNQTLTQPQHLRVPQQQNNNVAQQQLGAVLQNSGVQELYQMVNLSTSNTSSFIGSGGTYTTNLATVVFANGHEVSVSSSPSSSRPTLESTLVTTGGGGSDSRLWNNIPAGNYSTDCHF